MERMSYERNIKIWNDVTGEAIYVGPDGDSLGLVEIRKLDADGKIINREAVSRETALLLAKAILEYSNNEENF